MDDQQPALGDMGRPALVVPVRMLVGVPAVDEDEGEGVPQIRDTCGDRPTRATTCSSSPARCRVLRNVGNVSINPISGSTVSGS